MPEDDDSRVWEGARAGDREAFDALQKSLAPGVRRFTKRLLGKSEEVQEICQEAFLALY